MKKGKKGKHGKEAEEKRLRRLLGSNLSILPQVFRIIGELPDAIIFECLKCLHWFEEKKEE